MFGVQQGIDQVPGFLLSIFIGIVGVYFLQLGQNGVLEGQARIEAQAAAPVTA
jgi:hypothetical protein